MTVLADKRSLLIIACLVWLFPLAGLIGCGGAPEHPLSPQARAFANHMKEKINRFVPPLVESAAKQDVKKLSAALSGLFQEAALQGKPLTYALYVLDDQARPLAGHYFQPDKPAGVPDMEVKEQNYSNFKVISEIMRKPKIIQSRIYLPGEVYYAIFVPLVQERKARGILAIFFTASVLQEQFKLSEKDFLAIDFNH
jgi:hypothetical protein